MKFDDQLDFLRRVAHRVKMPFCDLLLLLLHSYHKRPRQFRLSEANDDVALEKDLIEEYRPIFRKVSSSKGGKAAAQNKRDNGLNARNAKIIEKAKTLKQQGKSKRELAGIISLSVGLTSRQIRNILKKIKKTEMQ